MTTCPVCGSPTRLDRIDGLLRCSQRPADCAWTVNHGDPRQRAATCPRPDDDACTDDSPCGLCPHRPLLHRLAAYNRGVLQARAAYQLDPFAGSREFMAARITGLVNTGRVGPGEAEAMRAEVRGWK